MQTLLDAGLLYLGPAPAGPSPLAPLEVARRESRRRVYGWMAARAGLALDAPSCWLLVRIDQDAPATLASLSARLRLPVTVLTPVLDRLSQAGLVDVARTDSDGRAGQFALTPRGQQARDRLVAARRDGLADLLKGWSPEEQDELAELLGRLARGLLGDDPGDRTLAAAPPAPTAQRG